MRYISNIIQQFSNVLNIFLLIMKVILPFLNDTFFQNFLFKKTKIVKLSIENIKYYFGEKNIFQK